MSFVTGASIPETWTQLASWKDQSDNKNRAVFSKETNENFWGYKLGKMVSVSWSLGGWTPLLAHKSSAACDKIFLQLFSDCF